MNEKRKKTVAAAVLNQAIAAYRARCKVEAVFARDPDAGTSKIKLSHTERGVQPLVRLRDAEGATLALVSISITPDPECGVLPFRNHESIEVRPDEG
jgi:hypothetical protein